MITSQDEAKQVGGWSILTYSGLSQPGFHLGNAGWHKLPNKDLKVCQWQRTTLCSRYNCHQASPVVCHPSCGPPDTAHPPLVVPERGLTVLLPQISGSQPP